MSGGVPIEAITLVCPVPVRIARAGDRYEPDTAGRPAWMAPVAVVEPQRLDVIEATDPDAVIRGGYIVDLVAFSLAAPRKFALRLGQGSVLGAIRPQCCDPEPVPIHRGVLGWLQSGCRGITILTADAVEAGRILRQISRVVPEDSKHGEQIEELLRTLPPTHFHTVVERPGP